MHARKNLNLILFFGKWCACATSVYLWPYVVRSTLRAGHGWFRRRSRPTWPINQNNTGERGASVIYNYIGKKNSENRRSFKKPHFGGGFFDSVSFHFFSFFFNFIVFRGSCLATSNKKPECEKNSFFFNASVNGSTVVVSRNNQWSMEVIYLWQFCFCTDISQSIHLFWINLSPMRVIYDHNRMCLIFTGCPFPNVLECNRLQI